jgi:hypothetical protein
LRFISKKKTGTDIMHFATPLTIFLSVTGALAQPIKLHKRAAGTSAAVLAVQTYNDFSVSAGVAGNALAEVNAKFPVRSHPSPSFSPSH